MAIPGAGRSSLKSQVATSPQCQRVVSLDGFLLRWRLWDLLYWHSGDRKHTRWCRYSFRAWRGQRCSSIVVLGFGHRRSCIEAGAVVPLASLAGLIMVTRLFSDSAWFTRGTLAILTKLVSQCCRAHDVSIRQVLAVSMPHWLMVIGDGRLFRHSVSLLCHRSSDISKRKEKAIAGAEWKSCTVFARDVKFRI